MVPAALLILLLSSSVVRVSSDHQHCQPPSLETRIPYNLTGPVKLPSPDSELEQCRHITVR